MDNKIILIMCDGMRPDFVMGSSQPFIRPFLSKSVYTMEARTTMPSVTLPCAMSLFYSVPSERHGILTNTWVPQVRPVRGLTEVLKDAGKSCAFVYDWEGVREVSRPGCLTYAYYKGKVGYDLTMPWVVEHSISLMQEEAPDFMYVLLSLPDSRGHKYGYTTPEYAEAVSLTWDGIQKIAEAAPKEYSIIVFADHGGHDRAHGDDIPEDMTIPIILHGDAFQNAELGTAPNIMDIAPTIVEAMGVAPDPEWEGKSMYRR